MLPRSRTNPCLQQGKYFFLILIFISIVSCGSQEKILKSITCENNITVQYENSDTQARREGLVANKNSDSFVVHFLNDFDDKIRGYINDKLLFDEMVKTDEVTDKSEKYFGYNYSKDSETPILKVSFVDKKNVLILK